MIPDLNRDEMDSSPISRLALIGPRPDSDEAPILNAPFRLRWICSVGGQPPLRDVILSEPRAFMFVL